MNVFMLSDIRGTMAILNAIVKCSMIMNYSVNGHWKFLICENPHGTDN